MHSNPLTEEQLAVTSALSIGDAGRLYRIVSKLFDDGVALDAVLFDVLLPAEGDVGGRWQDGDYLVPDEHLASTTIETVLSLLVGSFDQPTEATHVVVAAAEGDDHSIAGRAASAYLLFLGYHTTFLGANVPASELEEFLETDPPDVLVLSCTMPGQLVGARAGIRAAHRAGVPVIAGGRVFGETGERATKIGADGWARSPRDLPVILGEWAPDISRAENGASEPAGALPDIIQSRTSILANAEDALSESGTTVDSRMRVELALLLGAVEGALLLDDIALATEMIGWQSEALTAHGLDGAEPLRTSLQRALQPWPDAAAVLDIQRSQ